MWPTNRADIFGYKFAFFEKENNKFCNIFDKFNLHTHVYVCYTYLRIKNKKIHVI